MSRREFTLLVGQQFTGKTYQLIQAIKFYEQRRSIDCVHVVDTHGEMSRENWAGHDVALCHTTGHYHQIVADNDDQIPRIVIWLNAAPAYQIATEQGNCILVVDEAYDEAPAGPNWRGDQRLLDIVLRGRHLVGADGREHPCGVIMACQYPRSVHHLIYEQAEAVLCSRLRGEQARQWVRAYAGQAALDKTDKLEQFEWSLVAGRRPPWFS